MEIDDIMDDISKELNVILKAMAKTKSVEEKVAYSKAVKNMCESMGIFLNLASDIMPYDFEE